MITVFSMGGLGNQMFQYAFYKKLETIYHDVSMDIKTLYSFTPDRRFGLYSAFKNITLNENSDLEAGMLVRKSFDNRGYLTRACNKLFPYTRKLILERKEFTYDETNLKCRNAYYEGYWQTEKYWKDIKNIILHDFSFNEISEPGINAFMEKLKSGNSVSVHVRRGDYANVPEFDNICTIEYYKKAISYMRQNVSDPYFVFFSNDIPWVKENLCNEIPNSVCAMDFLTCGYPDWQDMMLMSCCRHNIIANSSFSWWGAYLNKNKDKIVIAPKMWLRGKPAPDIIPEEWIRV